MRSKPIAFAATMILALAAASPASTPAASPLPAANSQAGATIYRANCSACHGASGQGGMGLKLTGIAGRQTLAQTVANIEHPAGAMPKLYPGTLSDGQVGSVAAYIRATFR